jgi:hypothetical protein
MAKISSRPHQTTDKRTLGVNSGPTRRLWLQGTAGAAGMLVFSPLLAQQPELLEAVRKMSVMTGAELPERWAAPTASLIGVILQYSKSLRGLDLGEMEPATFFVARCGGGQHEQ